jgi:hypothetical protein
MKKFAVLVLAAAGLLTWVATAQAKEINSLKVCGASGCNTVTDREALRGWEAGGDAYPEQVAAPGAQRFYTIELGFGDGEGNVIHTEQAFWLPDGKLTRFKNDVRDPWWKASATQASMYQKAAAGLEAFTPKVKKVTVKRKTVADPDSYMRLFDTLPYVSLPKGTMHLISIVYTPDGVNPFLAYNGKTTLRYDAKRRLLVRADGYVRVPNALGKLVMARKSLTKTSSSGAGDGGTALYAGVGVGVLAALAVLGIARHRKMT